MIRRIAREPLVHFAVLAAGLFTAYSAFAPAKSDSSRIVVTGSQITSIEALFRGTWQRPPTQEELAPSRLGTVVSDSYGRRYTLIRSELPSEYRQGGEILARVPHVHSRARRESCGP